MGDRSGIIADADEVYDRRTGKKMKSKKFRGETPKCRKSTAVAKNQSGYPDERKVEAWLKSLLK